MLPRLTPRLLLAAAFLGCILAANYVTSRYGMVPVGFGLTATAGTYLAGATFVLRDTLHDLELAARPGRRVPRWVLAVIAAGAVLSFVIADPRIALASAAAFGLAELADLLIYSPLRSRGYLRAAVASNVAGAAVDTWVFLAVAGFPILAAFPGQMVGKLALTLAVVLLVAGIRVSLAGRRPAPAAG